MKNELLALDAAAATIMTASVNIRVLRVGTKQLTQAVFKQLPERHLIDEEGPWLVGSAWGWVNYKVKGGKHTEFIAQFGDQLCRCPVKMEKASRFLDTVPMSRWRDMVRLYAECSILLDILDGAAWTREGADATDKFDFVYHDSNSYFEVICFNYWKMALKARTYVLAKDRPYGQVVRNDLVRYIETLGIGKGATQGNLAEEIRGYARRAEQYAGRWDEIMERLKSAPQLFIAV